MIPYLVKQAQYLHDYKIQLMFNDGKQGIVDLSNYTQRSGVFEAFKDLTYFKDFSLDGITLTWRDEVDIAPERLYELAR